MCGSRRRGRPRGRGRGIVGPSRSRSRSWSARIRSRVGRHGLRQRLQRRGGRQRRAGRRRYPAHRALPLVARPGRAPAHALAHGQHADPRRTAPLVRARGQHVPRRAEAAPNRRPAHASTNSGTPCAPAGVDGLGHRLHRARPRGWRPAGTPARRRRRRRRSVQASRSTRPSGPRRPDLVARRWSVVLGGLKHRGVLDRAVHDRRSDAPATTRAARVRPSGRRSSRRTRTTPRRGAHRAAMRRPHARCRAAAVPGGPRGAAAADPPNPGRARPSRTSVRPGAAAGRMRCRDRSERPRMWLAFGSGTTRPYPPDLAPPMRNRLE